MEGNTAWIGRKLLAGRRLKLAFLNAEAQLESSDVRVHLHKLVLDG